MKLFTTQRVGIGWTLELTDKQIDSSQRVKWEAPLLACWKWSRETVPPNPQAGTQKTHLQQMILGINSFCTVTKHNTKTAETLRLKIDIWCFVRKCKRGIPTAWTSVSEILPASYSCRVSLENSSAAGLGLWRALSVLSRCWCGLRRAVLSGSCPFYRTLSKANVLTSIKSIKGGWFV